LTIKRHDIGPRMSRAVVHNGTVYLAGMVADDPTLSIQGQTRQVLDKIDHYLAQAGTHKGRILSANIWLADISMWADMNTVWDAWVVPGATPARATVQAKLAGPTHLVEIMVVAAAAD
jgi:enamine deaminase RidA (YjgF/YER057c/UK114 family)